MHSVLERLFSFWEISISINDNDVVKIYKNNFILKADYLTLTLHAFMFLFPAFLFGTLFSVITNRLIGNGVFFVLLFLFFVYIISQQVFFIIHYSAKKRVYEQFGILIYKINQENIGHVLPQIKEYLNGFTFEEKYYLFGEVAFLFDPSPLHQNSNMESYNQENQRKS